MKVLPNQHTRVCNCARCGSQLIGRSNPESVLDQARLMGLPIVAGRLVSGERNAPYCEACLGIVCPAVKVGSVA